MVVVVVPAFAEGEEGDWGEVAAGVAGGIAAFAEDVGEGVDGEGGVPDEHGGAEEADDEAAPAGDQVAGRAEGHGADPVVAVEEAQLRVAGEIADDVKVGGAVAAGEDPADVAPPEAVLGGVRVAGGVV
jgi:hypothetical protein